MSILVTCVQAMRDGGTITFTVDGGPAAGNYRLQTPFLGKRRRLFRDGRKLGYGGKHERALVQDLREWLAAAVTPEIRDAMDRLDAMSGWRNLPADLLAAVPFVRVQHVLRCLEARI